MGFLEVLMNLRKILGMMSFCKKDIANLSDFSDAIDAIDEDEPLVLLVKQGPGNTFIVIER